MMRAEELTAARLKAQAEQTEIFEFETDAYDEDFDLDKSEVETLLVMTKLEPSGEAMINAVKAVENQFDELDDKFYLMGEPTKKLFAMALRKLFADNPDLLAFRFNTMLSSFTHGFLYSTTDQPAIVLTPDDDNATDFNAQIMGWRRGEWDPWCFLPQHMLHKLKSYRRYNLQCLVGDLLNQFDGQNFYQLHFGANALITVTREGLTVDWMTQADIDAELVVPEFEPEDVAAPAGAE